MTEAETDPAHSEPAVAEVDRWASRKDRAHVFLRTHGLSGTLVEIRRIGAKATLRFVSRNLRYSLAIYMGRKWDRRHHVDTGGQIQTRMAGVSVTGRYKDFATDVVSTPPKIFGFLSQFFPRNRSTYTYIDMGCGKGRTVLMASELGFQRAIGVEFVDAACATARRNLISYTSEKNVRSPCTVIHADVTEFDLPKDNLVLYFANPFEAPVWSVIIAQIAKSYCVSPRSIYLVLSGSHPERIWEAGKLIGESRLFIEEARGTTPFYLDAYLPYAYMAFRSAPELSVR